MRGSISTRVTSVPNELQTVANSTPMAPAPMMITEFRAAFLQDGFLISQHLFPIHLDAGDDKGISPGGKDDVFGLQLGGSFHPRQ